MPAAILPDGCSEMELVLLSAVLLFVESPLLHSERDFLSEGSRHGPPWGQASGLRWPEAVRGRPRQQKGRQAQEKEGLEAEGSVC